MPGRADDVVAVGAELVLPDKVEGIAALPAGRPADSVLIGRRLLTHKLPGVDHDVPEALLGPGHLCLGPGQARHRCKEGVRQEEEEKKDEKGSCRARR